MPGKHKKNHRGISGNHENNVAKCITFFESFYGKDMEKLCLKASKYYSGSFWTSNCSICSWENPQTPHFHDFRISRRVPEPQNQLFPSS